MIKKMDSQTVEILGRNLLIADLIADGAEIAVPIRDRGIDIVAYLDLSSDTSRFSAIPIQMKASTRRSFGVDRKYGKISNLVIAYVWGVGSNSPHESFALTYREAEAVAEQMGWTVTASWKAGQYTTTQPSKRLLGLLAPYRIAPGVWKRKLNAVRRRR